MKKTYMEPTLTVVNVKIDNIMVTGSPNGDVTYTTESSSSVDAGEVGAREHHSIWDED